MIANGLVFSHFTRPFFFAILTIKMLALYFISKSDVSKFSSPTRKLLSWYQYSLF